MAELAPAHNAPAEPAVAVRIGLSRRPLAWLRRVIDTLPPTPRGLLVALTSLWALFFIGRPKIDLLVFVFGAAGAFLFVLSGIVVVAAALILRRRPAGRTQASALEAQTPTITGFSLPGLARWPLVQVRWMWLEPGEVKSKPRRVGDRLEEEVVAERRAEVHGVSRRIVVEDAFGLCRVAWSTRENVDLLILPACGLLRQLPILQSLASAEGLSHPHGAPEGDRIEIRRYAPGDPVRNILWKTFARTRQLNVRTPERSIAQSRRTVVYLLTGPRDEPAAAALRLALEQKLLGERFILGADGSNESATELDPALRLIARSGSSTRPSAEPLIGLRRFLESPEVRGERHCLVFAAPGAPATVALARQAGTIRTLLSVVLGLDGVREDEVTPIWRRLLWRSQPEGQAILRSDLRAQVAALEASGCKTVLVDRATGRNHGSSQLGAPAAAFLLQKAS